jgi:hypothetical protein
MFMNYKAQYQKITIRGAQRCSSVTKSVAKRTIPFHVERHRIIPGFRGGQYVKGNIAWLTPREHALAHILLMKIFPCSPKAKRAVIAMLNLKSGNTRNYNTKKYDWAKRSAIEACKEQGKRQMTKNWENPLFRQRICETNSRKMKERLKDGAYKDTLVLQMREGVGRAWADPQRRKVLVEKITEQNRSPKRRRQISEQFSQTIWTTNGKENRRIKRSNSIPEGWFEGRAKFANKWSRKTK